MIQDFKKEISNISDGNASFTFKQVKSIKRFNKKWLVSTMNVNDKLEMC
jgi:hypothetical protein